jgi:UDP-N-acetylglucosamine 2-epimerase (non-hydrolysing)
MKTAVVLGTRPEIIKMAPVVKELQRRQADYFILHTGQHYSYSLDRVFFEQLELPAPRYNLEAGSGTHAAETAKMLVGIEGVLLEERPAIALVEGDTNSVLAGALTAAKLGIRVGHVEAGLRSYDRRMPEEINRVLTDHLADLLFAPTPGARNILLGEGIKDRKIFVTGNTIVDAVRQNLALAEGRGDALAGLKLKPIGYFLVTLHRQENVDDDARFASILKGLEELSDSINLTVLYPVHPRARKRMAELNLEPRLMLIEPVDYFTFLQLESGARLILTDSGGVQEEACILGVPCVTLRDNTERPETVAVGANALAGAMPESILRRAREMLAGKRHWENPFGDGRAAERIVEAVLSYASP